MTVSKCRLVCGSIIHNGKLVIPYGLADFNSSFVTVDLASLLDKLLAGSLADSDDGADATVDRAIPESV